MPFAGAAYIKGGKKAGGELFGLVAKKANNADGFKLVYERLDDIDPKDFQVASLLDGKLKNKINPDDVKKYVDKDFVRKQLDNLANVANGVDDLVELTVNGRLIGKFTRGGALEILDDIALHGGNRIKLSPTKTTTVTGTLDDVNTVAKRGVNTDKTFNGITAAGQANLGGINILRSPQWGVIKNKYKHILDAGDELDYWKKVTDEFWETVNKPWLDDAISRGDNLRFVSNPNSDAAIYVTKGNNFVLDVNGNKIKSIFGREIDYLKSKGYSILSDGTAIK